MTAQYALKLLILASLALLLGGTAPAKDGRPRRILVRSSWQTVNIGDIGHTPGLLRLLAEHLPEVEVMLLPSRLDNGVEEMLQRNFPKVRIVTGTAVNDAFAQCDFFLHGSGPSLVGQKQLASWVKKTGKPYGIYGITLAGLDDEARELFDNARFAYFRDTISLQFAKKQGLKCPIMEFGPDAAFAVNLRNDKAALAFLREHGLEEGKFLCAIPRLRYTPYWKIHNKPMTEQDKQRYAESNEWKERDHSKLREAIVAFVRQTGMKVLVCPEDMSHMEVGKEMLVDPLPADVKAKVVWREKYWITDEAVSVYVRSLGLLSMDMHSPIMAVGNGIPAIHCRFHQQTSKAQMWKDIGLGSWLFDLDEEKDGANITRAVLAIANDPAVARRQAAQALEIVKTRQRETMEVLRKQLSK